MPKEDLQIITDALTEIYGFFQFFEADIDDIIKLCSQDKKNEGSTVNFSLLRRIGNCDYNIKGTAEEIKEAISFYQSLTSQVQLNQ